MNGKTSSVDGIVVSSEARNTADCGYVCGVLEFFHNLLPQQHIQEKNKDVSDMKLRVSRTSTERWGLECVGCLCVDPDSTRICTSGIYKQTILVCSTIEKDKP